MSGDGTNFRYCIVDCSVLLKGDYCVDGTVFRYRTVYFCSESISWIGVGSTFKLSNVLFFLRQIAGEMAQHLGIILFTIGLKAYCGWELAQHSSLLLFSVLLKEVGEWRWYILQVLYCWLFS